MSSISFPGHPESASVHSLHESQFSFADPSSSFQINPLSSHPPRTPRTSVASTSTLYRTSIYESREEKQQEEAEEQDEEEEVVEEELPQDSTARIRREDVWREMVRTSEGRDKAFKLIQYSIRVYLFFHAGVSANRLLRNAAQRPWVKEIIKRLTSTMSGLSFTRKMLLLFNWLTPLTAIMAQQAVPFSSENATTAKQQQRPFLQALLLAPPTVLLDLVNSIADDLYALSLLGILGKRSGERASRFADWCWWLATVAGLIENSVERQMIGNLQHEVESRLYKESMSGATEKSRGSGSKFDEKELGRLQIRDYWLQLSKAKLIMDLIFSSYDVFRIQKFREPVKAATGLTAAILSSAKLPDTLPLTLHA
uniref:Uncharacterized protein n=1 Tax=Moniliophthora roreri TaxID=221103 RepID=A0A0W0FCF0_MONRR